MIFLKKKLKNVLRLKKKLHKKYFFWKKKFYEKKNEKKVYGIFFYEKNILYKKIFR